jgi:hypothetical protein
MRVKGFVSLLTALLITAVLPQVAHAADLPSFEIKSVSSTLIDPGDTVTWKIQVNLIPGWTKGLTLNLIDPSGQLRQVYTLVENTYDVKEKKSVEVLLSLKTNDYDLAGKYRINFGYITNVTEVYYYDPINGKDYAGKGTNSTAQNMSQFDFTIRDAGAGKQMNRLLQGDVGSGKTIVALLSMLIAADNGFQSVIMAPTEILAQQHFRSIAELLKEMPISVKLLTGSTVAKQRKEILSACEDGSLSILIGTHAVIEDKVLFKNLGFAVIDEQHKFGVAQRAKLWKKNSLPPHVLVMTATPIPRTLALTAYGDLDYSVIDELPPGRKPIETIHQFENKRPQVMDFIKKEITKGRQVYIVYPLIEDSATLDYENLMKGFEEVKSFFH